MTFSPAFYHSLASALPVPRLAPVISIDIRESPQLLEIWRKLLVFSYFLAVSWLICTYKDAYNAWVHGSGLQACHKRAWSSL